jgi:DNA-directed RNA polymerase subunit E'/Rpb7
MALRKTNTTGIGKQERKIYGVYSKSMLETKVLLSIVEIGKNIKPNLENKIISKVSGKCINEGFVKPNSVKIVSYSSGSIMSEYVEFHVIYECMICLPVEGMLVECSSKTITKAGIHAQVIDEDANMPLTVFIARDHHSVDHRFQNIKEGNKLTVRIIGIRYELNDNCICAIAKLVDSTSSTQSVAEKRPQIRVLGGEISEPTVPRTPPLSIGENIKFDIAP